MIEVLIGASAGLLVGLFAVLSSGWGDGVRRLEKKHAAAHLLTAEPQWDVYDHRRISRVADEMIWNIARVVSAIGSLLRALAGVIRR
ncbi:MAG: hypothetical protein QM804_15645 [Propionicimonas sp.]